MEAIREQRFCFTVIKSRQNHIKEHCILITDISITRYNSRIHICNTALTALKYFYEQTPEYHIVCAGSLLGITLSKPLSFPVEKADFLMRRPMCFFEFVLVNDEGMLLESTGMANKVNKIEKLAIPLSAYSNTSYFTVYMADAGLLRRMSRLPASSIFEKLLRYIR